MKLKTRLIIAFFVIIFVPVFLTSLALFGFGRYQLNSIEETYGIKDPSYDTLSNSVQMVSKFTQKSFEEMQDQAGRDPDMFLDRSYLDTLNEKLSGKASYLIVRRGGEMYYSGKDENIDALFEELPPYGDYNKISDSGVYIGKDVQAFVKQMDVDFTDGSEGSVFIITSVSATLPQIKSLVRDMVIAIIVILIFTAGFLTMWIYNGISTPLKKLKLATQNIKEGNLDFTMEAQGDDEISGLCRDFEQMRRRLKESSPWEIGRAHV